jgi:hypothetical protein
MTTLSVKHQEIIRKAMLQWQDAIPDGTLDLWERLAFVLVSIIGEGGFQSLYSRSLHLAHAKFPWLPSTFPPQPADSRFSGLKASLEGQDSTVASEASVALLLTFIDILTLLIGEHLTTSILRSAWGDDAVAMAAKEFGE